MSSSSFPYCRAVLRPPTPTWAGTPNPTLWLHRHDLIMWQGSPGRPLRWVSMFIRGRRLNWQPQKIGFERAADIFPKWKPFLYQTLWSQGHQKLPSAGLKLFEHRLWWVFYVGARPHSAGKAFVTTMITDGVSTNQQATLKNAETVEYIRMESNHDPLSLSLWIPPPPPPSKSTATRQSNATYQGDHTCDAARNGHFLFALLLALLKWTTFCCAHQIKNGVQSWCWNFYWPM